VATGTKDSNQNHQVSDNNNDCELTQISRGEKERSSRREREAKSLTERERERARESERRLEIHICIDALKDTEAAHSLSALGLYRCSPVSSPRLLEDSIARTSRAILWEMR